MTKLKLLINGNIVIRYKGEYYKSVIQDISRDYFYISIPTKEGSYLIFNTDDEIEIEYFNEENLYYCFKSRIIKKVLYENLSCYMMAVPYDIRKIQRRDFARVNFVEYTLYKKNTTSLDSKWSKGVLLDLSGGGARMKIFENISIGDEILIKLDVDKENIEIMSKVVRVEIDSNLEYICGLQFLDMYERKRDKIIKKVFIKMRKQRELI